MGRPRSVAAASLAFAFAAAITAAVVVGSAAGEGWAVLVPAAAVAAAVVAAPAWAWIARRQAPIRVVHGCLAGAAVGIVAHPLMWWLAFLFASLEGWTSQLGEPTAGPVAALAGAGFYGLLGVVLTGWITVPVGCAVGGALAYVQRRRTDTAGRT